MDKFYHVSFRPVLASSHRRAKIRSAFKFKSFEKLRQVGAVGCKLMVEASTRFDCGGEVTLKIEGHEEHDVHIESRTLDAGTDWFWIETKANFHANQRMKFQICCRDLNFWRGHYGPKIKRIHVSLHCWTAD